jgi:hypothetical protein
MLRVAECVASARKRRLWGCALCRLLLPYMRDRRGLRVIKVVERFADGEATERELRTALNDANSSVHQCDIPWSAMYLARCALFNLALNENQYRPNGISGNYWGVLAKVAKDSANKEESDQWKEIKIAASRVELDLWKELLGNPFAVSPFKLSSIRLGQETKALAQEIYATGTYEKLPELGERLTADGMHEERVHSHCRRRDGHYRGCWVLDEVLAKA